EPGPLRPVREVFLRRRSAAAARLQASRRKGMRILVVSCYELGRQPLAAAGALAALERAGFTPEVQDVAVEKLSEEALRRAELILVSVPMHTALQLGVRVAARAREVNPAARIAFFGLDAVLN